MNINQKNQKLGIGTLSPIIAIIGVLFSFSFKGIALGDLILPLLDLKTWSNGNTGIHYTLFYSLIFYIPALIIGYKYQNHRGSKLGRGISMVLIVFTLLNSFFIL